MTNDNFYFFSVNDFKQNFTAWMQEYFSEHPIVISKDDKQDFFTADETASYLKVSKSTIFNWTVQGKLTAKKIGRKKLYAREQIASALKNMECLKYSRR